MGRSLYLLLLTCCFYLAASNDPECVMELECEECVPENMPVVTSHGARGGAVRVPHGDEVTLSCAGGSFLAYPLLQALAAVCEAGRYRVRHDHSLRHLLDLGCQENVFEDGLHPVEQCAPPLQGRAYSWQAAGGARHLATLCFDSDRALAVFARACNAPHNALPLPPHRETGAPLSLLGNFNHMFDANTRSAAERLYSDDARMTRRLRELLKHDDFSFAGQSLTSAPLLAGSYFEDQNARVADFVSNRVAVWASVAAGNLRHVQRDVSRLLRARRPLQVYSGTHGTLSLRAGSGRREAYLKPGRFPVPRYIWTLLHDTQLQRAVAIVLLNDPFVAVSEIREAVFCESECGRVSWLRDLRANRNYEVPVYGLVFCCSAANFTAAVPAMPRAALAAVPAGHAGMLLD